MESAKRSPVSAVLSMCIRDKSFIIAVLALVMGISACILSDLLGSKLMVECAAAFLFTAADIIIVYSYLAKKGIDEKSFRSVIKSFDPRICGLMEDVGGIGAFFSAVASVALLFSQLYIAVDGIFSGGYFSDHELKYIPPILYSLSFSLLVFAAIYKLTAAGRLHLMILSACAGRMDKNEDGRELSRIANGFTSDPELMAKLQNGTVTRFTVMIAGASMIVIGALSGMNASLTLVGLSAVSCIADIAASLFMGGKADMPAEGKVPLLTKNARACIAVNVIAFLVISIFFLYSFPSRSVFTEEISNVSHTYDYTEEYDAEIHIMSVPGNSDVFDGLYLSYYLFASVFAVIAAAGANSRGGDISTAYSGNRGLAVMSLVWIVFISAAGAVLGYFIASYRLGAVQVVVIAAYCSTIVMANIIRGLVSSRRKKA
ncbi:MAG: hypothetical protein ACI4KF_05970 [Huintestinicola sp.]